MKLINWFLDLIGITMKKVMDKFWDLAIFTFVLWVVNGWSLDIGDVVTLVLVWVFLDLVILYFKNGREAQLRAERLRDVRPEP